MATTRLGAYPVREFNGLIFAYLGPPNAQPAFPIYDTFALPDTVTTPYAMKFNCNWIQVLDAIADPVHTAFLHHDQFSPGFGELGEIRFYEREKIRFLGVASRRVGDNVWVRVNELILPNFTQAGAAFAVDGSAEKRFGRSAFTRWVVPNDDAHCTAFAWANFGDRADRSNTHAARNRAHRARRNHRTNLSPTPTKPRRFGSDRRHGRNRRPRRRTLCYRPTAASRYTAAAYEDYVAI